MPLPAGKIVDTADDIFVKNGQVNLPRVVVSDRTPRGSNNSIYTWENFRAPVSNITTIHYHTNQVLARQFRDRIQDTIGTVIKWQLNDEWGDGLEYWVKVINVDVTCRPCYSNTLSLASDTTAGPAQNTDDSGGPINLDYVNPTTPTPTPATELEWETRCSWTAEFTEVVAETDEGNTTGQEGA